MTPRLITQRRVTSYQFWYGKLIKIDASQHLGLVGKVTLQYVHLKAGERVQDTEAFLDGCVGLAKAVKYYDPSMGNKFSTFAFWCIRNEIWSNIRQWNFHSGQNTANFSALDAKNNNYSYDPGKVCDFNDQFDILEFLNELLSTDDKMTQRQKEIVRRYFYPQETLEEIGRDFNICRERVRQIRDQALACLKNRIVERFPSLAEGAIGNVG